MNKDIEQLLPFYVNGTLEKEENARVAMAVADDPALQEEVKFLRHLNGEVKKVKIENSPGELGLKRLQQSLQTEKMKNDPIARARSKVSPQQNWGWRVAAMVACLLLVIQTVATLPLWQADETLVAASGQVQPATGPILSVTFVPQAREESIRALLLAIDARIVDGPSALGVYRVAVKKDPQAAIEKLQAHKNLIESVQLDSTRAGGQK